MDQSNVIPISNPQESSTDALTAVLRQGAQQLLTKALEAEIENLLSQYSHLKDQGSLAQVVRNGYLPERAIQSCSSMGISSYHCQLGLRFATT